MRYFSPSTSGFYSEAIHGAREIDAALSAREAKAGKRAARIANPDCTIPDDAIPVSEVRFADLMRAQAEGKAIYLRSGKLIAANPVPKEDERIAARRRARDKLLNASDWTQLGDAEPPFGAKAWAAYRRGLRDLDMDGDSFPPAPGAAPEPDAA